MQVEFTVLGSGSAGNASLLEVDGFGLLIDAGLGPRQLADRLEAIGRSWDDVHAALLTHVHTDHWRGPTFRQFFRRRIPLYCHAEHLGRLRTWSEPFCKLESAGLVPRYAPGDEVPVAPRGAICVRAFRVSHDCRATFGFRIDCEDGDRAWSMGYATDLGTWTDEILACLIDVDLLALEFNHDVQLQRTSGRPADLISRVLGDEGHLSNDQAGDLLREVARGSTPGRLRSVVQLHLSRDCNRPHLARQAAERALEACGSDSRIATADQLAPATAWSLPIGESLPGEGARICRRNALRRDLAGDLVDSSGISQPETQGCEPCPVCWPSS